MVGPPVPPPPPRSMGRGEGGRRQDGLRAQSWAPGGQSPEAGLWTKCPLQDWEALSPPLSTPRIPATAELSPQVGAGESTRLPAGWQDPSSSEPWPPPRVDVSEMHDGRET